MSTGDSNQKRVIMAGLSEMGSSIVIPITPPAERPRWLWPQRIPLGCVTLLAGEPQAGKSYLTLDLAARTSRGGPWPGEGVGDQETGDRKTGEQEKGVQPLGPGSVLMVPIEDSWHDTIRPRLAALGADLSKFRTVSFGPGMTPDLHVEYLQETLWKMDDCRLIVIDPVSAFMNELGGTSGSQGRRLVYSLAECVHGRSIAMVLVTHLRSGKGKALHLPSGNDALVRAARSAWLLTNDPADTDRRLLLSIKNNLGPPPSGLAFTFEPVGDGEFARLGWDEEPVPLSADEFLRETLNSPPPRDHKLCAAVDWLRQLLRDDKVLAAEIQQAAKARGISYGTLRRAFDELGCESVSPLPGEARQFFWRLRPATDPA
jgi:AAA domain